jgi:signal transduction histidine kinase/DNA-binding response OmpR family regulator
MHRERILVIGGDAHNLESSIDALEQLGYQVTRAHHGQEALDLARTCSFDLVLSDLTVFAHDKLDVMRAIKEMDPSTVQVAVVGQTGTEAAAGALGIGADDVVIEPFSAEELEEVIASALARGRVQRENIRLRALIPLYELSKAFMGMTNLEQLLTEIVEVSCRETGADRASLMLLNEDGQTMTIHAAVGLPKEVVESTAIRLGEGISGIVAQRREPVVLDSAAPPSAEFKRLMKLDLISSAICVPLTVRQELIGVLNLSKLGHNQSPFTAGSLELASVLAGQSAIAIKNARLFEETQRAYSELKKLDKLKSEFINIASHELRTPLTVLLGYAALLDEQANETTKRYTQSVIQSANRLNELVTDMLNLRYLEAGEMELELRPLQVSAVAEAVVHELGLLAEEKAQHITIDVPEGTPVIWADARKMHLILSNLVSNAIKFTPQGGEIEIAAATDDDELTMSVRDTGIGIPQEELDRLFDRFYQVGESLRREYQGLGLGLSIAKELVKLHQGKVWLESEVGKGSAAFFTISRHLTPPPKPVNDHERAARDDFSD